MSTEVSVDSGDSVMTNMESEDVYLYYENEPVFQWKKSCISQPILAAAFRLIESSCSLFDDVKKEPIYATTAMKTFENLSTGRKYLVVGLPQQRAMPVVQINSQQQQQQCPISFGNVVGRFHNYQAVGIPPPPFPQQVYSNMTPIMSTPNRKKRSFPGLNVSDEASQSECLLPCYLSIRRFRRDNLGVQVELKPKTGIIIRIDNDSEFNVDDITSKINTCVRQMDNTSQSIVFYSVYDKNGALLLDDEESQSRDFWFSPMIQSAYACPTEYSLFQESERIKNVKNSEIVADMSSVIDKFIDAVSALKYEWKCGICNDFMNQPIVCTQCHRMVGCKPCVDSFLSFNEVCPKCHVDRNNVQYQLIPVKAVEQFSTKMRMLEMFVNQLRLEQQEKAQ